MSPQNNPNNLPVFFDPRTPGATAATPATAGAGLFFSPDITPGTAALPLSHYLYILRRHLWKILAFVAVAVTATVIVSFRLTPIYESTAVVYIDRQAPSGIVGQESQANYPNLDAEQFLATQVKLVQSDAVLRPVTKKYNLLEHERQFTDPARRGAITDAPVTLKKLKVTRPPNTYLLQISYRSPDPELAANVANGVAQAYLEHTYNIRIRSSASLSQFMEKQLEELRAKMEQSSAALVQFERELSVINPEEKTNILSARLLQLNTEYTAAQGDRVRKEAAYNSTRGGTFDAAMVSSQGESLRKLTERQNEAMEKFAEVKAHFGANHPEYRKSGAQLAEVQKQLDTLRDSIMRRVEVEFREAENREKMLYSTVMETKAEYDRLNARSFDYQRLKREAEADKKLYEELVRKIRESSINAGFQSNEVRIADLARPGYKPVFPNIPLNALLAFLFSTLVAVGAAILSDALDNSIRDPEQVARTLNTHVVGTLPSVPDPKTLLIPVALGAAPVDAGRPEGTAIVAVSAKGGLVETNGGSGHRTNGSGRRHRRPHEADRQISTYDEAIRTLRSSILLTDFDRRIRTLLFTSASPGEGKSTTAGHMAYLHAEQKKRTLLIDCDLRRPSQHRIFGIPAAVGLSDVLLDEVHWRDALVHPANNPNLDILSAGPPSRRAADLIGPRIQELLDESSQSYDLIILDGPPLLGFAESLQMASAADAVVIVTRAGETSRKAVQAALQTLTRIRANVVGVVLNQVKRHMSDQYYYYGYYGKHYKRYIEAK